MGTLKQNTMKVIKLKDFMQWYFSDENSEGFYISDKAVNNLTELQVIEIEKLFKACKIIPMRLIDNNSSSDISTDKLILKR